MYDVKKYQDLLTELNGKLWDLAEIRFEEYESAGIMTKILEDHGYRVERGAGELPTAYRAVYGEGKPVIGLLAEYDALDGLSQQADKTEPVRREETTHGHGCGHHLLGTGVIGAALSLKDYLDENYSEERQRPQNQEKSRNQFHNFQQRTIDYDAIVMERMRKRLEGENTADEI